MFSKRPGKSRRSRKLNSHRPLLEELEHRCLLSVTINEYAIPPSVSLPLGITSGPDNNLWFTDAAGSIGQVNPATHAIMEFPIPTDGGLPRIPLRITPGPDGKLYFSAENSLAPGATMLGSITPLTHMISELQTGMPGTIPGGITAGPNGSMWFTEVTGNAIGTFDVTNDIAQAPTFAVPTPSSMPLGIVGGPDGNLWFAENGDNVGKIAEINPATHAITEFVTPTPNSQPISLAIGADGNLWFTESTANRIGMMNLSNHLISEFILPTANSHPVMITAGGDGNLWFTENSTNAIGMIDPATHVINTYPIPTADSQPFGIAAGPDGNLWFTESNPATNTHKIGQVIIATGMIVQPRSQFVDAGENTSFTATASDQQTTVSWQVSRGGGNPFVPLTDSNIYNGTNTGILTITNVPSSFSGNQYRAVFTHTGASSPENVSTTAFLTVNAPPAFTFEASLQTTSQVAFDLEIAGVVGGTLPYTTVNITGFSDGGTGLTSAMIRLLGGTSVSDAGISIQGTPTAPGVATFTVNATDWAGFTINKKFTIIVNPPLSVTASLPAATVGTSYNQTITISGGTLPYGFTTTRNDSGTPVYVSLSIIYPAATFFPMTFNPGTTGFAYADVSSNVSNTSTTITLQGTPTDPGTATFTFIVVDAAQTQVSANLKIAVDLPIPTLTGPAGPVTNTAMPTITWSDTGATHYDLWVDDITAKKSQFIRQMNLTTTSFQSLTPLVNGHQYLAWVRGLNSAGQASAWSQALSFAITLPAPPVIPTLTAPGGTTTATTPTITWTDTHADHYDLWIDDATAQIHQVVRQKNLLVPSFTPGIPLVVGHQYEAWIEAFDSFGQSGGWSQALIFTINQPAPAIPTLTGPSSPTSGAPTFTWTDSVADHYDLWVNDTTANVAQVVRQRNLSGTSFTNAGSLTGGHHYTAWIEAFTSTGVGSGWSQPFAFDVAPPPPTPTITGPSNAVSSTTPTLTWSAPSQAATYELWLSDNTTNGFEVLDQMGITAASFSSFNPPLIEGHRYTAWVRAYSALNQPSLWSAPVTFTIVPAVPVLIGPINPTSMTPLISWTESSPGPMHYDLWVNDITTNVSQVIRQEQLTATSYATGPLTHGHTYWVWVQAIDALGQASAWQSAPLVLTVG